MNVVGEAVVKLGNLRAAELGLVRYPQSLGCRI